MVKNLSIIQWNARSLNNARLAEFRSNLSIHNPSIVLLSETHWSDSYSVRFKSYNCIVKNRPPNGKGGVAILIKKSIPFIPLSLPDSNTIESVGISILIDNTHLDVISSY